MSTPVTTERRHEPRVKALDLVHVEEYAYPPLGQYKTDDALGRTLDLSHHGMRLQLDHPLHLRTRLHLDLALGNTILRLEGRVRSAREVDARVCEMGIEFVGLTADQYDRLDAYLHLRGD